MNAPTTAVAMPPRPTRTEYAPLEKAKTIGEAMQHPEMLRRLKAAAPRHISPERMLRLFALAMAKTPKIAQCELRTLIGAMIACASLGLEPNTPLGLVYLIPFDRRKKIAGKWETVGTDLQVIIGYRGRELPYRYGELGHPPRAVFDMLLRFAVSEDGALHAEKYYRTVTEEFASTRPAYRWRHLAALARVTASEYGRPAPGVAEARELLRVSG